MADDYAASTATTGTVAIGGSATGNIETTNDADWFKVNLTAGQTYEFKLEGSDTGQGTLQYTALELRDSAGNHLLYGGSSDTGPGPGWTSLLTYTATTTGTYYLASLGGTELGTYTVSAASLGAIADDYAASTATTGTVAIGGSATGNIETTNDADWFKVNLTAGQTYEFKLEGSDTGQGTLQYTALELRDSAGNHLLYGGSSDTGPGPGWTSLLTYTATTTGTYYLASLGGTELGTYTVSAASLGAIADDYAASTATTGTVAIGGSATGNIETTNDADWFKVNLTAGQTYEFKLEGSDTGQGTLQYTALELRDSAGNHLLYGGSSDTGPGPGWTSLLTYTATTTGTYYLASLGGTELGTYTVSAASLGAIADHPPMIISDGGGENAAISLAENSTSVTTIAATDPDFGSTLTYSIIGGADLSKFEVNATTGALTFLTAPHFEAPTDADHINTYIVQVGVSDGTLSDMQTIIVTVTDVNELITSTSNIQNAHLAITRTALPLDQATMAANSINAGTQTEFQYINNLIDQVENSTIPAVAVEGTMYDVVPTSAELDLLVNQFLPGQVANATKYGLHPLVYASEALGLAFAFGNETGSTAFANLFGPTSATIPNSPAGDAAFSSAAVNAIFGAAASPNLISVMSDWVTFWKGFYSANGIPGVASPTAQAIDLAARAAAWGDAVGVALDNDLGPLKAQATNFLMDAAQGTAEYSASLIGQTPHDPFHGELLS